MALTHEFPHRACRTISAGSSLRPAGQREQRALRSETVWRNMAGRVRKIDLNRKLAADATILTRSTDQNLPH